MKLKRLLLLATASLAAAASISTIAGAANSTASYTFQQQHVSCWGKKQNGQPFSVTCVTFPRDGGQGFTISARSIVVFNAKTGRTIFKLAQSMPKRGGNLPIATGGRRLLDLSGVDRAHVRRLYRTPRRSLLQRHCHRLRPYRQPDIRLGAVAWRRRRRPDARPLILRLPQPLGRVAYSQRRPRNL